MIRKLNFLKLVERNASSAELNSNISLTSFLTFNKLTNVAKNLLSSSTIPKLDLPLP